MKPESNLITVLAISTIVVTFLMYNSFQAGTAVESRRIYNKCLIEQQDKSHKEAVELCKERTKE